MKKIISTFLLIVLIFTLTGCGINAVIKSDAELNELEDVSMTIKEGTLNRDGATIIITDTSDDDNMYGESYRIDKKVNDTWEEKDIVVKGNYGWNSIGYRVDENDKLEMDINWKWLYGTLEDGEYRLVKNVLEKYFSVEFEISSK